MKVVLSTALKCAVYYLLGWVSVQILWPILSPLTQALPVSVPVVFANAAAFLLLFTITHMEDGKVNPMGLTFLWMYWAACFALLLSTLHPMQYNEGMAAVEAAFVIMLTGRIAQRSIRRQCR